MVCSVDAPWEAGRAYIDARRPASPGKAMGSNGVAARKRRLVWLLVEARGRSRSRQERTILAMARDARTQQRRSPSRRIKRGASRPMGCQKAPVECRFRETNQ